MFFRTTRELEYLFFCRAKREFVFELTVFSLILDLKHDIFGLFLTFRSKLFQYCLCMLVALIDIFVIKLFSYDLKDHTFILDTGVYRMKIQFII
jgi:hypothetical protein